MKLIRLIFFFLVAHLSFCQEIITGSVEDFDTEKPLAYVNIGIKNKKAGTVSDNQGAFRLFLPENITLSDTVVFSHLGFKTERYSVLDLRKKRDPIVMISKNTKLEEVVVNSDKITLKPKRIGRSSKGLGLMHSNFYTYDEKNVDDRLSKERGMKLKIRRNCHIEDLNFNITSNDFKSLKFRLNFYKIQDGLPTELMIHKNIIFEIKDGYLGWFKVDLTAYDIFFGKEVEEVAVTIQWLESVKLSDKSKYFAISTEASPLHMAFFREKAMDTWKSAGQNLSFYLKALCD